SRSEILRDRFELFDRGALLARQRADRLLETVFDVVVNQCLLGLCDGLLDRLQLLSDVETRPLRLDHVDDAAQMPFGTTQAPDDLGMGLMDLGLVHSVYPILPER